MGELPRGWEKGRILAWRFILDGRVYQLPASSDTLHSRPIAPAVSVSINIQEANCNDISEALPNDVTRER
jgi:hypothetical protein